MSFARLKRARNEGCIAHTLEYFHMCYGGFSRLKWDRVSAFWVSSSNSLDRSSEPVPTIFEQMGLHRKLVGARASMNKGEVMAFRRVGTKLRRQGLLREPGPREDDEPRGVLVDAMNDAKRRPYPSGTSGRFVLKMKCRKK